ncbi:toluene-4-monooxygenase system B family protein [Limibacillus sp. MBR-115]|jgi:hypothetical protein|uniref:toluene-4-monooxygenase system B family protein n=1 Tax=Limibacillus sp. MBR-115 TaxID=3156465 RepID=UPI0033959216
MANFPLVCNFEGDYGLKLLMVDEDNTIDEVVDRAVELLSGVVVPKVTDRQLLLAKIQDGNDALDANATVKALGLTPMEVVEIYRPKS